MEHVRRAEPQPQGLVARLVQRVRQWLRRKMQKEEPNIYPFF
jgi:hypothetical protein